MKIVFSTSYYYPYLSGLSISLKELAEGLALMGHSCTVFTNKHAKELKSFELIDGVGIVRFGTQLRISKALFSIDWLWRIYGEIKSADRVVINLPQPEGIFTAIATRLLGKKLISLYVCDVNLKSGWMRWLWEKALDISSSVSIYLSDLSISYTLDYARESRVLKRFLAKTVGIYPPVPNVREKPKIGSVGKKLVIGMVARIAEEKGFEQILKAIPEIEKVIMKPVWLKVAGPVNAIGEEKYASKIIKLTRVDHLRVKFLGTLTIPELDRFYQSIDILAVPSTNSTEAFGLVQVEAMKRGVPVVASDLPGVRIPIKVTGMGKLCRPKDIEDLVQKVSEVALNRSIYAKRYQKARQIFDYYSLIKCYEKFICH